MPSPDGVEPNLSPFEPSAAEESQGAEDAGNAEGALEAGHGEGTRAAGHDHTPNESTQADSGHVEQNAAAPTAQEEDATSRPGSTQEERPHSPEPRPGERNGSTSRKRSRSGSLIQTENPSADAPPRETPLDKVLLEQYLYREWEHAAADASQKSQQDIREQKRAERDYYLALRQERQANPGAVFGAGYEGYGNARTDLRGQHPQLLYPSNRKRPGGRKARELRIPRDDMATQAEQPEDLVPIRLDVEWDKVKLRDTFTWNLHDRVTPPEIFAEKLVEDLGLPLESCGPLVRQITQSIQDQLTDYYPQVYFDEDPLDHQQPYHAYKNDEMRILIKLNITIGQHTLVDQFEWEINNPHNSPEEFATQMTRDLSLAGEFTTAIAHSIREQVQLFTRSLYIISHPFDGRPIDDPDLQASFLPSPLISSFRPFQAAKEFSPYLYELNEADLERTEVSISRDQRRQKRSVNRRGGPALPDLKDRQRTIRTMVVSSVIPGAAPSIDESRLLKRSSTTRSRRAAAGQRETGDESEESMSDDSSTSTPVMSHLSQGTARTRGMRTAASAAQNAMRATMGRSATPEVTHEPRPAPRRREIREEKETPEADDKLIVKLKISPTRFRQFMKDLKSRPKNSTGSPAAGTGSTRISMGPPSQQSQSQSTSSTPKRPTASQVNGVVDAPHPPQPGVPGPPPPPWLVRGLNNLKRQYPRDSFEGIMRYTAVDPQSGVPLPNAATTHPGQKLNYKYFPRIRCHDCPGKLYTPGPAMTVDNFEVHLKNRHHKERVEERHAKAAGKEAGAQSQQQTPSSAPASAAAGGSGTGGGGGGGDDATSVSETPTPAAGS